MSAWTYLRDRALEPSTWQGAGVGASVLALAFGSPVAQAAGGVIGGAISLYQMAKKESAAKPSTPVAEPAAQIVTPQAVVSTLESLSSRCHFKDYCPSPAYCGFNKDCAHPADQPLKLPVCGARGGNANCISPDKCAVSQVCALRAPHA